VIIGEAVAGANFEHSTPLALRETVRDTVALGA
jgi:uroporphyrin-III C-methyltransferase/precorrin-2 dehydrogenase/sirohydrochlorin ferrochelatase